MMPPRPVAAAVGRPAPTPAAEVLKDRAAARESSDGKDYRTIQF
jgi:hypothetical protein